MKDRSATEWWAGKNRAEGEVAGHFEMGSNKSRDVRQPACVEGGREKLSQVMLYD